MIIGGFRAPAVKTTLLRTLIGSSDPTHLRLVRLQEAIVSGQDIAALNVTVSLNPDAPKIRYGLLSTPPCLDSMNVMDNVGFPCASTLKLSEKENQGAGHRFLMLPLSRLG